MLQDVCWYEVVVMREYWEFLETLQAYFEPQVLELELR